MLCNLHSNHTYGHTVCFIWYTKIYYKCSSCNKTYFFLKKPTCVTVLKFESNAFHKIVPE